MSGYFPKVELSVRERQKMERISGSLPTKAAKIRALHAAGYMRQAIAAFLGIRYQHVRNVLIERPSGSGTAAATPELLPAPAASVSEPTPSYGRASVDEKGRIGVPALVLAALEVRPGGWIPWRFEDGELKLMDRAAGIRFAQSMVADLAKQQPGSWSDELIAERRAAAAREDAEQRRE